MRLEIELRCILFSLISLEIISTTWLESTRGKFNWLDMIWKDTPVYIRSHSWQCMSVQKSSIEVEGIVRRAPRQGCVEKQIWGRVPKHFCSIECPQEHNGLHHPLRVRSQTTAPHHCQTLPKTLLRAGLSNRPGPGIVEGYWPHPVSWGCLVIL